MKQLCKKSTTRLCNAAASSAVYFCFAFGALVCAFMVLDPAHAAVPSLTGSGLTSPQAIQLTLRGEDGTNYQVEVSTNLLSWEPYLSLTTTNGIAVFTHQLSNTPGPVFFRAAEEMVAINPFLTLQPAPYYGQQTIVTPEEGAVVDLLLPDLRHITLTIPPGCVSEPTAFSMTLVTNISGLPFAQGFFGAVTLEPEEFMLTGAAALEIDLPAGADTREVASFGSGNDGSLFHLVLDRLETNRVMIPISRFATYGSGLATPSEVGGLVAGPRRKRGSGPSAPSCPPDPPHLSDLDRDQFPKSCNECFQPLVDRALAVESHLRQVERCIIDKSDVMRILSNRNNDGAPEDLNVIPDLLTNLCPFYQHEVLPLWPEAQTNCALAKVLLLFTTALEAQVQKLGVTNLACKFTLDDNAVAICISAHECLQEISLCCEPGGHKGSQKIAEAVGVIRQFEILGYACFPEFPNDSDWKQVVQDCSTNAWIGTVTFRQQGADNYSLESAGTTTTVIEKVDVLFRGQAGYSYELQPPGEDGFLEIDVGGNGLLRINSTLTDATAVDCTNYTKGTVYMERQFDAIVTTNYVSGTTNDNAVADYNYTFTFNLKTNRTYELLVKEGSAFDMRAQTVSKSRSWGTCPGTKSGDSSSTNAHTYHLPTFKFPFGTVPTFPWTTPDTISGSADWRETNSYAPEPVVLQTHVDWTFQRNTNVPSTGP